METRSWSFLAGLFRSPSKGVELADTHVFLHRRVALYTKTIFLFVTAFTLMGVAEILFMPVELLDGYQGRERQAVLSFVGLALVYGGAWLYLRRAQRSVLVLHLFESGGTVLLSGALASASFFFPDGMPKTLMVFMLVLALVIRAGVVPSGARLTALVGLVSSAVLAISLAIQGVDSETNIHTYARYLWIYAVCWGAVFSIATALVSRVIYGLHQTVREAMRLGNYTLERKLGEGGMGVVYLAHHALLRRPTAVKLLPPDKSGEESVSRFEREVQETSRLTHPNTVAIYDFGRTPDGIFYYVMEYLDGLNLRELVALAGPLPAQRVIRILEQVAHALAEAHDAGLVHRDIKPANIVVCNRGGAPDVAKVVDFGLVKDVRSQPELNVSAANTLIGTPLYLAPEALTDPATIDHRIDIYALGAVGYYAVTGQHLFEGKTVVEICGHQLHTVPEPPSVRLGREIPADFEQILLRCLAKKPADSFSNGMELADALHASRDPATWNRAQAAAWWAQNADAARAVRQRSQPPVQPGTETGTMAVDFTGRIHRAGV